jgi:hypothetical protein
MNLLQNDISNNFNGNLFKKIIKSKILNKDLARLKQKTNNSILSSNSAQNILKKNSALNSSSLKPTKKHFLKKDIFNGTFYQNKSSSTKSFFFPRKSEAPTTNKKVNINNKRLTSSSSIRSLKKIKNERNKNNFNVKAVLSNGAVNAFLNNNIYNKEFLEKKNINKNLPFINNFSWNKKNFQNFRSNLIFAHNIINNKSFLNANGFLSEKIKDNDIVRLKRNMNNNAH